MYNQFKKIRNYLGLKLIKKRFSKADCILWIKGNLDNCLKCSHLQNIERVFDL